ncbi:hypothetical protein STEG23_017112, partial [Scotinomys teguina]
SKHSHAHITIELRQLLQEELDALLIALLRRSGTEPALSTFLASKDNKGQEVNEERNSKDSSMPSSPDSYRLLHVSWSGNSAPQDDEEEETGSTITFSCASFDVLRFLEDTNCEWILRPQDVEAIKSFNVTRGVNETGLQSSERTRDVINSIDTLQHRNTKSENGRGVYFEEISNGPISPKDRPQGALRVSNSRRGWTGFRIIHCPLLISSVPEYILVTGDVSSRERKRERERERESARAFMFGSNARTGALIFPLSILPSAFLKSKKSKCVYRNIGFSSDYEEQRGASSQHLGKEDQNEKKKKKKEEEEEEEEKEKEKKEKEKKGKKEKKEKKEKEKKSKA